MNVVQPQPAVAVQVSRELVDPKVVDTSHRPGSDLRVRLSFGLGRSCPSGLDIELGGAWSSLSLQ